MTAGRGGLELAELLEELKQRSGRSYAALAHRTGLGRSTVHRYCLGTTVPRTFGAVEKVARVCGADRAELDRLYRAWCQAIDAENDDGSTDGEAAGSPESAGSGEAAGRAESAGEGRTAGEARTAGGADAAGPSRAAEAGRPRAGETGHLAAAVAPSVSGSPLAPRAPSGSAARLRTYFWLRFAALVLVLAIPSGAVSASYPETESGGTPAGSPKGSGGTARQDVKGPDWTIAPQRVSDAFYGMNLSSDTGETPGFRVGSLRLWHSGTRWSQLEPRRGKYRWQTLDRLVEAAERKGLPVLLTLGGTPPWAVPDGRRSVFADARSSPPDKLADWDRFIGALAARYRGRIEAYELWDYPSDRGVWSGSMDTLADMVQRASRIIGEADPDAKAVCPSFGALWEKRGRDLLRKFARTGTFQYCDAAALKLPPRRADGPPEERVALVKRVQRLFYSEGLGRTVLWDTGPDRDVALREHLDERRARNLAVRFYLVGLYLKDQGLSRTYFYSWGSSEVPLVVELAGGPPTEAGRRIGRLQKWLEDARITSCGSGTKMGLAPRAYTCRFEREGRKLLVYWTERGKAEVRLGADARLLRRMDGTDSPVPPGRRLRIGEEPVLVEHRRTDG